MNKISKNASWIIVCKATQAILAVIINMLITRYLGPSNYGVIVYASSLVAFILPISQLGFNSILVKEFVDRPNHEGALLGTSILLSALSSFFSIISVTLFVAITNRSDTVSIFVTLLYSLSLIFQSLDLIQYWYQAKLKSKYTSIVGLIAYLSISLYKVYLLYFQKSVYWFALSNAFDLAIISIANIAIYRKIGGQAFSFSWDLGKDLFSKSKHYIISSMMITIFSQTDKIMLKSMISDSATGYYGAATVVASFSSFVFVAIIESFRPYIFDGKSYNNHEFNKRITYLYSIIIYLSFLQSLFTSVFSSQIIQLLYGKQYAPAIPALAIIVWYSTFAYIGSVRNIWILANNKQSLLWIINLSGALFNVVLNLILIPFWGICGAAFASLLTQFFTNFIIGYLIRDIVCTNYIMIRSLSPKYIYLAVLKVFPKFG